ncbi:O-antigen ligase family protein [uncultured Salinicola sp.]|uniref:O-antigen ligase family protein n=1 Tax=uncultured Salinicola sp. TaxID=1193542 RepID=UPI0026308905|nr:O-antigen ligase family protein [uncultured Salinicola sp.]
MGWYCPRGIWWLGFLLVLVYAAFGIAAHSLKDVIEPYMAFLGLASLLIYGGWRRKSVALILLVAVCLVQIVSWWLAIGDHPQWARPNPDTERLAKLFIFIAIAWWLRGSLRHMFWVWGLALVAFLLTTVVLPEGRESWLIGLQGERVGFGIQNNQHASMLFGVALLGLCIFARRFCWSGGFRRGRACVWFGMMLMVLVGILFGQTRAVWLALFVSAIVALLAVGAYAKRRYRVRLLNRKTVGIGAGLLLAAVIVTVLFGRVLADRALSEDQIIAQLLSGRLDTLPYTSIGIRIHSWVAATQWIGERPWIGWGSNGRELVIEHTPWLPEYVKTHFGHLHNFLLETLVNYGVLGLACVIGLMAWVGTITWRAWSRGDMPNDVALFAVAFFCYWLIVNQFESYLSFWTGIYVHNLIVAGLVTLYWRSPGDPRRAVENRLP